jgi:raffinose/stachyose/melibiose transport system permease protein
MTGVPVADRLPPPPGPVLVAGGPTPGRRRPAGRAHRRRPSGLPWILPSVVLSVGLIYYCIAYTGYISTLNWDGISPNPQHVGVHNYTRLLHDPLFWGAVRHTIVFFVVTFAAQTVLGLLFAVLLHSRIKLAVIYKVIIFVPVVLAPAIMAPVFRQMLEPNGQLNTVLHWVGLGGLAQPWIGQTSTSLPVIMVITVWEWTGLTFVLYYAAMSQIDESMLEAARLDGAGNLRIISAIIWPSVRGTTAALATLSVIGALKTFDVPWLVTSAGPNYATNFFGTYIYQQTIPLDHVGYGAALSIVLLVVALLVAVPLQRRIRRREVMG